MRIPTHDDVKAAHERIAPHVHRTPVLTSASLDRLAGAGLFFKCENFQRAGAFKARGASNAVFGLSDAEAGKGVATHSSGNHAQALAWAARRRGIPCHVVMPDDAVAAKKQAVAGYGGRIVECEPSYPAREAALAGVLEETGAAFVHPYDDPRVIAGQATCAVELMDQTRGLDAVIAPIGGGGMVSGICLALSAVAPDTAVYAAEPEQADDAARSLRAGRIVAGVAPQTIADGLKAPLGDLTWHFVSSRVADILTVSEREIVEAMKLMWTRLKTVVEPSSAVPLAAILKHGRVFAGRRVGVVVTGGNVDPDRLPWMAG
ncbi:MAG: pyridoxal-phosphate dependent enzyme [Defluviicoccus sp.]|nr:pyridoxal-phosphate dependent enzyme [Defluviicoccus sp.]MDE0383056.1 pyridoxal-phosphate dependent enzyme [Defluviicoccus sp.]